MHHSPVVALSCTAPVIIALLLIPSTYVTLQPGVTINMLGDDPQSQAHQPILQISGHQTYPTTGQIRFTTVSVIGNPRSRFATGNALAWWWSGQDRLMPMELLYPPDKDVNEVTQANQAMMTSSQDLAKAAAMHELGIQPNEVVVASVGQNTPAAGMVQANDRIISINGQRIQTSVQVSELVRATPAGHAVQVQIERKTANPAERLHTWSIIPRAATPNDPPMIGVSLLQNYPVQVGIHMKEDIGGPSAGTMMALSIYDELTPGALTGGRVIAGTGTIDDQGNVGEISGIEQKVVAAKRDGATVFFSPAGNCADARAHLPAGLQLVKVGTLHEVIEALNTLNTGGTSLPSC